MLKQTITTEAGTYEIVYPSTDATLASTSTSQIDSITSTIPVGATVKNVYAYNLGIGGPHQVNDVGGLYVEGQTEDPAGMIMTAPSDGIWEVEMILASYDPNLSMLVKHKIQINVINGFHEYMPGFAIQSHQQWIKSPDTFPPTSCNTWMDITSTGLRCDVYGFYAPGCDYKGTVTFTKLTNETLKLNTPTITSGFSENFIFPTSSESDIKNILTSGYYKFYGNVFGFDTSENLIYSGNIEFLIINNDQASPKTSILLANSTVLTELFNDGVSFTTNPTFTITVSAVTTNGYDYSNVVINVAPDATVDTIWYLNLNPTIKIN